jgi:D-threo-aldose 1-dehydrogenase
MGLRRVRDYSRDGVRRSLEESLERLGLDRIDVALVHDAEDYLDQAIAEALSALAELREQGVVRAIGAGMNFVGPLARVAREADVDCLLVAGRYTLLDRSAEDELLALCQQRDIGVLAAGVFNSGILATPSPGATYNYGAAPRDLVTRAQRIADVCARFGVELPVAAIALVAAHPAVESVVLGASSVEQVTSNVARASVEVPPELWRALEEEGLLRADR